MSVKAQGVDVHVEAVGSGQPVLFLHGNPDSSSVWSEVIPGLSAEYRCICIDLPGFGRSIAPMDFDCSIENLGLFVNKVLGQLEIDVPIDLVAHDLGGAFAMSFAHAFPEKVRRIVLIGHPIFVSDYQWHFWARIWRAPILGEATVLFTPWLVFFWSIKLGAKQLTKQQIRSQYESFGNDTRRMVLSLYRAIGPREFKIWGPRTLKTTESIPTLALWGEHDIYVPLHYAHQFGAKRVKSFSDSGHWLPLEAPGCVSAEIAEFLAS